MKRYTLKKKIVKEIQVVTFANNLEDAIHKSKRGVCIESDSRESGPEYAMDGEPREQEEHEEAEEKRCYWTGQCHNWKWNCHPIEIAQQLKDESCEDQEIALACISEFFGKATSGQIEEFIDYV